MSVGERLAVGVVRGIHGLRGAVKVEILTDRPDERFQEGARLFREGSADVLTVTSAHADAPGWLVRFAEIPDRSAAETLRNVYLEVEVGPADELPRGAYYWHQLIGTPVLAVDGTQLGTVQDVYRTGGADVFLVRGDLYGEFDVPVVREFIRIFAPNRGEIVVDAEALDLEIPKPRRARGRRSRRAEVTGIPLPALPVAGDATPGAQATADGSDAAPGSADAAAVVVEAPSATKP